MGESLHKIRKEYHRKIAAIKKEGEDKAQVRLSGLLLRMIIYMHYSLTSSIIIMMMKSIPT